MKSIEKDLYLKEEALLDSILKQCTHDNFVDNILYFEKPSSHYPTENSILFSYVHYRLPNGLHVYIAANKELKWNEKFYEKEDPFENYRTDIEKRSKDDKRNNYDILIVPNSITPIKGELFKPASQVAIRYRYYGTPERPEGSIGYTVSDCTGKEQYIATISQNFSVKEFDKFPKPEEEWYSCRGHNNTDFTLDTNHNNMCDICLDIIEKKVNPEFKSQLRAKFNDLNKLLNDIRNQELPKSPTTSNDAKNDLEH